MPSFFCLTIRFLQPYSHGRGEEGEPEWPPSPLRAFQALVAAAAARWNERLQVIHAGPALQWMEQLPTPTIIAAVGAAALKPYLLYIPNNTADLLVPAWKGGDIGKGVKREQKSVRPTHLRDGDAVYYLFPLPEGGCPFVEVLSTAARSITHLGWGVDMVAGHAGILDEEEVAKLPGARWFPVDRVQGTNLRVPTPGTLTDLAAKHAAFLNRLSGDFFKPVPPLTAFRVVGYRRVTDPPVRHYAAFRLRRPLEDRSAFFSMVRANCVAAMTRHATACAAKRTRDLAWIDRYVHGHREAEDGSEPRFSYLPLPSIQVRGERGERGIALGGIRRVLVAELFDAEKSDLLWVRQTLPGRVLTDEKSKESTALLVPMKPDWVLHRYVDPAANWATVTPLVLPGSDDGKSTKTHKLFLKALRHAGFSPESLATDPEFRKVSYWPGGELAHRFLRPIYLKSCSVYHVHLRFRNAIPGPLALGAGRHCGLGIFAAFEG